MKKRIFSLIFCVCLVLVVLFSATSCTKTNKMNSAILALNECDKLDISLYTMAYYHIGSKDEEQMQKHELTVDGNTEKLVSTFDSYGQTIEANTESKTAKDTGAGADIAYEDYLSNPNYRGYISGLLKTLPTYCLVEARFDSVGKKQTMTVNLSGADFVAAYGELDKIFDTKLVALEGEDTDLEYTSCQLKIITRQGYLSEIYLEVDVECGFTSAKIKLNLVCNSMSQ